MANKKVYLSIIRKSWDQKPENRIFKTLRAASDATMLAMTELENVLKKERHNPVVLKMLEDGALYLKAEPLYVIGYIEEHEVEKGI